MATWSSEGGAQLTVSRSVDQRGLPLFVMVVLVACFCTGANADSNGWGVKVKHPQDTISAEEKNRSADKRHTNAQQTTGSAPTQQAPAVQAEPSSGFGDQAKTNTAGQRNQRPVTETSSLADNPAQSAAGLAQRYCQVVVDEVLAAKLAEEKRRALQLKKDVEAKIIELEAATAEQKKWLQLRRDFQDKATERLVDVYAKMDAEAAALRLSAMGDDIAAAILSKLSSKSASAVMGEMQPEIAGRLTAYMAGAAAMRPDLQNATGSAR